MTLHKLHKHGRQGVPADIKAKVIFLCGGDSPMSYTDISRKLGIAPSTVRSIWMVYVEKNRVSRPNRKLQNAIISVDMQGIQAANQSRTKGHEIAVYCSQKLQKCDAKTGIARLAQTFKISCDEATGHYKRWRDGCRIIRVR